MLYELPDAVPRSAESPIITSLVGTVSVAVTRLASERETCSAPVFVTDVALGDDDSSNYIVSW